MPWLLVHNRIIFQAVFLRYVLMKRVDFWSREFSGVFAFCKNKVVNAQGNDYGFDFIWHSRNWDKKTVSCFNWSIQIYGHISVICVSVINKLKIVSKFRISSHDFIDAFWN
ncbi:hypothetical protein PHYBLDRAFT_64417 [Phycomyces blakesleeanus NRRL 1555(-)]|uniref:Uncharacterized protein n=1 Tax=Phycomyces blakesleeanus (strain ATCC 8743b / DSM 1359 / FGSC 10004 / NBRC 33097 / NRRL 1555) TaxID=763407 RepID=A0A163ASJ8_PHYB8|nr:hypothetical protein PHYBLDRAFT_64417 [Phycomyces blakesleeanus NRRL 1555(-)]OAD75501.1 hypothetical protein PHYBLDRAFT_64417 [Phycomyces blakesleeanus NRRL 1555(-)]|eukprot:XP_018293541.1 hypothetical protein PHYBLDRAFT_64417 [Phycomyces blakesleeanus NRRL 1555(-)]